MESHLYICEYCKKEYVPKRRRVQKYCSNSCRSSNHQIKNKKKQPTAAIIQNEHNESLEAVPVDNIPQTNEKNKSLKVEEISIAGVTNAAIGAAAANAAINLTKSIFIPEHKKPATKEDILDLINSTTQRYHKVSNLPFREDGAAPYFDIQEKKITYFKNGF